MDEWQKGNVKEHKSREGVGAKDDYNIGTVVNYTSPHSNTPFTRYNRLSNRLYKQPVVKPVVIPVVKPF